VDPGPAQVADALAVADPVGPGTGSHRSSPRRPSTRRSPPARASNHRSDVALRVVCHLAAELPIVLFAVVELARGWRPLFDNADLALRSWQVFGPHSPLVGHQMAVSVDGHAVFGPGPLQSWILAVPVRIDPSQAPAA